MLTEKVSTGGRVRFFELPEATGGHVSTRQYRGRRNLVIFFMDSVICGECRERLKELAAVYEDIRDNEGELMVVLRSNRKTAQALKEELGLKNPVLYDESGDTFRGYAAIGQDGNPVSAILVTDRFGEVYYSSLSGADTALPPAKEIIAWLEFIEVQCPE